MGLFWILQGSVLELHGQVHPSVIDDLNSKERFEVSQWLRLAHAFSEVGDYALVGHYCRQIIEYYPNTYYSEEAERLLEKSSNPKKNRSREYRKNNPALFPQ